MERIWHHYSLWEDYKSGLWKIAQEDGSQQALALMQHTPRWIEGMRRVINEWPYASEHNLSHTEHNRVAWLGQAAVCLLIGQPAQATKAAWWQLTDSERNEANCGARQTIAEWEAQCHALVCPSMF